MRDLAAAARALCDHLDNPLWRMARPTLELRDALRTALSAHEAGQAGGEPCVCGSADRTGDDAAHASGCNFKPHPTPRADAAHDAEAVREACAKACDELIRRYNDDGYADRQAGRSDSNACQRWTGAVACRDAIRSLPLPPSQDSAGGRVEVEWPDPLKAMNEATTFPLGDPMLNLTHAQHDSFTRCVARAVEIQQRNDKAAVAAALRGGPHAP